MLDLRPLVLDLGDRFSFIPDLESRIPPGTAQITILKSSQLKTAQDITKALRGVADWIWVLVAAVLGGSRSGSPAAAGGSRCARSRSGSSSPGFLVLAARTIAGRYLVSKLVVADSVRPAASHAYAILTHLLKGAGWTAVIVGVVALVGVWLAGPGGRATDARRWLAPYLRRPEIAYGGVLVAYLLLLWWKPTPQFAFLLNVVLFLALLLVGLETLRRLTAREFPDAEPGAMAASARGAVSSLRRTGGGDASSASAELERLARLHDAGTLDDAEFAAAKAKVLAGSAASSPPPG